MSVKNEELHFDLDLDSQCCHPTDLHVILNVEDRGVITMCTDTVVRHAGWSMFVIKCKHIAVTSPIDAQQNAT